MNRERIIITTVGILIFLILILFFIYTVVSNQRGFAQGSLSDTEITNQISKYMLLPNNEEPTVGTINDIDSLKSENPILYQDAKQGDKIIVYKEKAIIYRETTDMIINATIVNRTSNNTSLPTDSNK